MTQLKRLTHQGAAEVDEGFATGDRSVDEDVFEQHSDSVTGVEVNFEPIEAKIEEIRDEYRQYDSSMDAALAPVVHSEIDLTRRQAIDDQIWHRLAVVECADFVRHRWNPDGAIVEKFLGETWDIYTNAIGRLWWLAELTYVDPDDPVVEVDADDEYELTREVFKYNFLANRIVDNDFHRSKPVVLAVVDQFHDSPQTVVNDMPDRLKTTLSVMPAEGWVEENALQVVKKVRERMEAERGLTSDAGRS